MSTQSARTTSTLLTQLGDFTWVRAHVSMYAVGVVVLAAANLLIGGEDLWSLTAIGIWSMLLIVHLVLLAIARLSVELMTDDDEEIVILPVKDAVIVNPEINPTFNWNAVQPEEEPKTSHEESEGEDHETVSWQIATDAAQARRTDSDELETPST